MFDWTATVERQREPFCWGLAHRLIPSPAVQALVEAFPRALPHTVRESGSDKSYSVHNIRIFPPLEGGGANLPEIWQEFIRDVRSERYRGLLESFAGSLQRDAYLQVEVNEYWAGGFMSAHTDRHPKIVSHIFYLNEVWAPAWGGCLTILSTSGLEPMRCIIPAWPASVILVRSDASWHEVDQVRPGLPAPRRTIQVSFWAEPPPQPSSGRRYVT